MGQGAASTDPLVWEGLKDKAPWDLTLDCNQSDEKDTNPDACDYAAHFS